MEGVGIWAMVVLAFDRGSRQHDMKSLEVNFSSLKMESPREGRCKRKREKERERDRVVETSGETRPVPNPVTT